ncbi:MAG TPA: aminotransferase class V-fold PLP-dependent enzyme [Bryobacteraceae bacterium]|nr:aminotransferase class V-fold PLP-dependent enzyme [Bryobacteraceae bacterium]
MASGFALTPEEFRKLGYQAVDMAADYLAALPSSPVFQPMQPGEREAILSQPMPDQGFAPTDIFAYLTSIVLKHPMGNGHPRFFGWVNSPPALLPVITELLAAAMNPSCAGGDHAAIYLEHCAVRWLMELVGFPMEQSIGMLVSGASAASIVALGAARHWAAAKAKYDIRARGLARLDAPLRLYTSTEAHSCIQKAVELLGLGSDSIRRVPVDAGFRIDVDALRSAILRDRDNGLRPFCVVANAGTVSTGAIDPLWQLAALCGELDLWLHVDGAYGAPGILDPGIADLYRGLERVDSLALDPHKWLSVPVECGCVFVRDGELLRDAFSLVPAYIRTEQGKGFGGMPWFSEYGIQQTRGFRAMKLWTTLVTAGRAGLAQLVARHRRLAQILKAQISAEPDLQLAAPVILSIVCFRYRPRDWSGTQEQLDAINQHIMETLQSEGRVFVTNTVLNGRFVLRACILHYETTEEDLAVLVDAVLDAGRRGMAHKAAQ